MAVVLRKLAEFGGGDNQPNLKDAVSLLQVLSTQTAKISSTIYGSIVNSSMCLSSATGRLEGLIQSGGYVFFKSIVLKDGATKCLQMMDGFAELSGKLAQLKALLAEHKTLKSMPADANKCLTSIAKHFNLVVKIANLDNVVLKDFFPDLEPQVRSWFDEALDVLQENLDSVRVKIDDWTSLVNRYRWGLVEVIRLLFTGKPLNPKFGFQSCNTATVSVSMIKG